MSNTKLKAEERKVLGRKVKNLRAQGRLPANLYGKKTKSQAVQVDASTFATVFAQEGETGLVELEVAGKSTPVLITNVQVDPVTDKPIHADFMQVNLKEKVTAKVPVELIGESPAEKQGIGVVVQLVNELEVEALPMDLPENFTIDVATLENVDQTVTVADLKVDKSKVEVKADAELLVVKVEAPREEEVEPVPVAAEEGEAPVGEETPQEGAVGEAEAAGKGNEQKESKDETPEK